MEKLKELDNNNQILVKETEEQKKEEAQLDKPITTKFLLVFTIPTILSFIVMGIFGLIDGLFATRRISVEALSAVNTVMPFFTFAMSLGSMLAMGGSALIAKKMGAGKKLEARQNFTLITIVTLITSGVISLISWFFTTPLLNLLGTDAHIFDIALEYIQPIIIFLPFVMLGMILVQFLITEGKPVLSAIVSTSGAILNTLLNVLFLFVFDMGIVGLALATGIGYAVPTLIGLYYFGVLRNGTLYLVKPKFDFKALFHSITNGLSEGVTMLEGAVTTVVMNNTLVRLVGFEGVASAGIVMAIQGIFASLFFGYASGIAPVISFNFGKENTERLQLLFKKSMYMVAVLSLLGFIGVQLFASQLVEIYVPYGSEFHTMTVRGLRLSVFGFLLMGYNVFAPAMFTAFNNGPVSGFLSFMRSLVFTLVPLVLLPRMFDLNGVWLAIASIEVLTIFVSVLLMVKFGKKYQYLKERVAV